MTAASSLRVSVLTWNIEGHEVAAEIVASWKTVFAADVPDVVVVGFQELKRGSSPLPFLQETTSGGNNSRRCSALIAAIQEVLPIERRFVQVQHVEFGYKSIEVFAAADVAENIASVEVHSVGQGLAHVFSDKGAVAIRMMLPTGESLCLVNCHLQAHQGASYTRRRSEQMQEILPALIDHHDHVLWFGDFNFRQDPAVHRHHTVLQQIEDRDWASLVKSNERASTRIGGFDEAEIHFAPTYKFRFEHGRALYNRKRVPSYCDRVLYRGAGADCLVYEALLDQRSSDHMPVHALYKLETHQTKQKASYVNHWPKPSSSLLWSISSMLYRLPIVWKSGIVLLLSGVVVLWNSSTSTFYAGSRWE